MLGRPRKLTDQQRKDSVIQSRLKNKDKIYARNKMYAVKNREKLLDYYRHRGRMKRFGITKEEYDGLLVKQNGVCAICEKKCPTGQSLSVDHNHETGAIRGLLCRNCNSGIGLLGDSEKLLRVAIKYLQNGNILTHTQDLGKRRASKRTGVRKKLPGTARGDSGKERR